MSNDLEQNKRLIKSVEPLIKSEKIKLDSLMDVLEKKNREFDKFKTIYDDKFLKKNELLSKIESISNSGGDLDLSVLSNVKYYLSDVNEDLIEASSSLRSKKQAVDRAATAVLECHVDVKLMEKYKKNKTHEYEQEVDKRELREIEDMWLQNNNDHNKDI